MKKIFLLLLLLLPLFGMTQLVGKHNADTVHVFRDMNNPIPSIELTKTEIEFYNEEDSAMVSISFGTQKDIYRVRTQLESYQDDTVIIYKFFAFSKAETKIFLGIEFNLEADNPRSVGIMGEDHILYVYILRRKPQSAL